MDITSKPIMVNSITLSIFDSVMAQGKTNIPIITPKQQQQKSQAI